MLKNCPVERRHGKRYRAYEVNPNGMCYDGSWTLASTFPKRSTKQNLDIFAWKASLIIRAWANRPTIAIAKHRLNIREGYSPVRQKKRGQAPERNKVLVEELKEKAINEKEILDVVEEEGNTWMTPICEYLAKEILPEDKKKARAVRRKAARECNDCQIHRPVPRNPQQNLTPITSPWPFYKWGIEIAGPFPEGPGKVKFLIVAIDYFTKWIEAKAVATITSNQVKKFVWDNIVCRFGLPGEIISDNGKQFRDNPFKDWKEGSRQQFKKQKARKRWKNITTQESAAQVLSRATWSTAAMKQVMPGMKANLDPSRKDRMKLKSRLEKEHTNSKTAKEMKCRGHGTFVISKSVIYMKCKNPSGTYYASKGNILIYPHLVIFRISMKSGD
ncbi:reverse transcriptase domain-containing protein [Tanacetum coccineum]